MSLLRKNDTVHYGQKYPWVNVSNIIIGKREMKVIAFTEQVDESHSNTDGGSYQNNLETTNMLSPALTLCTVKSLIFLPGWMLSVERPCWCASGGPLVWFYLLDESSGAQILLCQGLFASLEPRANTLCSGGKTNMKKIDLQRTHYNLLQNVFPSHPEIWGIYVVKT